MYQFFQRSLKMWQLSIIAVWLFTIIIARLHFVLIVTVKVPQNYLPPSANVMDREQDRHYDILQAWKWHTLIITKYTKNKSNQPQRVFQQQWGSFFAGAPLQHRSCTAFVGHESGIPVASRQADAMHYIAFPRLDGDFFRPLPKQWSFLV